jgi:hypothetical protein
MSNPQTSNDHALHQRPTSIVYLTSGGQGPKSSCPPLLFFSYKVTICNEMICIQCKELAKRKKNKAETLQIAS